MRFHGMTKVAPVTMNDDDDAGEEQHDVAGERAECDEHRQHEHDGAQQQLVERGGALARVVDDIAAQPRGARGERCGSHPRRDRPALRRPYRDANGCRRALRGRHAHGVRLADPAGVEPPGILQADRQRVDVGAQRVGQPEPFRTRERSASNSTCRRCSSIRSPRSNARISSCQMAANRCRGFDLVPIFTRSPKRR